MSSNHDDYYDSSQTSDVSNKLHSSVDLLTLRTLSTRGNFSSQENEKKVFGLRGVVKKKEGKKKCEKCSQLLYFCTSCMPCEKKVMMTMVEM